MKSVNTRGYRNPKTADFPFFFPPPFVYLLGSIFPGQNQTSIIVALYEVSSETKCLNDRSILTLSSLRQKLEFLRIFSFLAVARVTNIVSKIVVDHLADQKGLSIKKKISSIGQQTKNWPFGQKSQKTENVKNSCFLEIINSTTKSHY